MTDIDNNAGLKDPIKIQEAQVVGSKSPVEETEEYNGKVKVINNITGEILEREYKSIFEAKQLFQEIAASEAAFKRAKEKIKAQIERFMATYDEYEFADGDRAYWISKTNHAIGYSIVAEKLGEDVAALFSEIKLGKLKDYLQECIDRGEMTYEEKDELLSHATSVQGKAYITIGKAKR